MTDSVSAACRVIRIGTFKFINAPNARTDTDLTNNLHLYPDHFIIQLPNLPEINVKSAEILQILTFFGRELPRALMCVLITPSLARSITSSMGIAGFTSMAFCPSSKDLAEKFIVLFPSDESSFEFQLLGDKFTWFSKRTPLRTDQARDLVLATAGRKQSVTFIRDITDNQDVADEGRTECVVDDQPVQADVKNPPILLSPIFATPGAVKLLTRKELDHLALARTGISVLRKREHETSVCENEGTSKVRKGEEMRILRSDQPEVVDSDAIIGQNENNGEIFTVPLCDLDKNGMYVEENTSEVVIENGGDAGEVFDGENEVGEFEVGEEICGEFLIDDP